MTSAPYDDVDPDRTGDVEPADMVEQNTPTGGGEVEPTDSAEDIVTDREADPADVAEQSRSVPADEDYPRD